MPVPSNEPHHPSPQDPAPVTNANLGVGSTLTEAEAQLRETRARAAAHPAPTRRGKTFKCRVLRGLHNDGVKTYSKEDGWFDSPINLVERFGADKFELYNPSAHAAPAHAAPAHATPRTVTHDPNAREGETESQRSERLDREAQTARETQS